MKHFLPISDRAPDHIRVVTENGAIVTMRHITSICIRIARRHDGCASALAAELIDSGRALETLRKLIAVSNLPEVAET